MGVPFFPVSRSPRLKDLRDSFPGRSPGSKLLKAECRTREIPLRLVPIYYSKEKANCQGKIRVIMHLTRIRQKARMGAAVTGLLLVLLLSCFVVSRQISYEEHSSSL